MRRTTFTLPVLGALIALAWGCDLEVENPNEPDRARALATGDDVESLIRGSYVDYWSGAHWLWPSAAIEVASNHATSSWGNFGMNDFGRRPREPVENTSNYAYRLAFEFAWEEWYAAVAAGSDGLRAIETGVDIGPGGERNPRSRAFAKLVQGLAGCMIGLFYDQAFLVDETTDLTGDIPLVPYGEVVDFYVAKLQEAAQIAQQNSFVLEDNWIKGNPLTNTEVAALARSYMARCKANVARSPAERAGLDWPGIIADVDAGLNELVIAGDGSFNTGTPWWDGMKTFTAEPATWARANLDWVGQADQSGGYQEWLATPVAQRQPVKVVTPDLRFPQVDEADAKGVYIRRESTCCIHPPDRGTYHWSWYSDHRYEFYFRSCAFGCVFGPIDDMIPAEFDLYKAEGMIHTGNPGGAAALINKTRVGNGGLTPVAGAGTVPTEPDGSCVPRKRFDEQGTCGDLLDALQWEHDMEVHLIVAGLTYFFTRGHGELVPGTPVHLPIPAKDLETLQMDVYTFGGEPECGVPCGSAPVPTPAVVPGDLTSALERVAYSLDAVERRRELAMEKARSSLTQVR